MYYIVSHGKTIINIRQRQYETLGNQLQIDDLANQPNGIYILNIKDDERNFQVKLVKQ